VPDGETIRILSDVLRMRDGDLRLAEENFSLSRKDAAAAVRQNLRHK
jgi:hypothetical protein